MATCVRNGMVYVLMTVNKLTVSFIHLFNFEWPIVRARRRNDELRLSAFGKIASSINLKSHFSSILLSNNFNPDRLFEWIGLDWFEEFLSIRRFRRSVCWSLIQWSDVVASDDKKLQWLEYDLESQTSRRYNKYLLYQLHTEFPSAPNESETRRSGFYYFINFNIVQ